MSTPNITDQPTDTSEYVAFVRRILAALERRITTDADLESLALLVELHSQVDGHIWNAVAKLRHDPVAPASWAEIGRAVHMTRGNAQRKYGRWDGLRRPGGQPANLR